MTLGPLNTIRISGEISTDDIIPAHWKHRLSDPAELSKHIFENRFPDLRGRISGPSLLINNAVFGIGSSREQAVTSLLSAGIVAVVAPAFGRIFFRNSWNLGLAAIEASADFINEGDSTTIDFDTSEITGHAGDVRFASIPEELIAMRNHGGLLSYTKRTLSGDERKY